MDPVSFLFTQVLNQVDYLFENGHLSQENYSTVTGALLQATPPRRTSLSTGPSSLATVSQERPPLPSSSSSAAVSSDSITASHPPPRRTSKKSGPSTSSLLKFKSKASSSSDQPKDPEVPLPTAPFGEADEPKLGKTNKRLRTVFAGGFILSQVVDQALSLTPGVPESLRESIVEKVEEASGEYVKKATDPRNQALWKQNASKVGSSAWKVARGGGGTSQASSSRTSDNGRKQGEPVSDAGLSPMNTETGEFSIITSQNTTASQSITETTSTVHSFFAGPLINVTTVVTVSVLPDQARQLERDFSLTQLSPLEELAPSFPPPSSSARPQGESNYISGRDW